MKNVFFMKTERTSSLRKSISMASGVDESDVSIRDVGERPMFDGVEAIKHDSNDMDFVDEYFVYNEENNLSEYDFAKKASASGIHVFSRGENENQFDDTFWLRDFFNGKEVGEVNFDEDDDGNLTMRK